jgi:hypothetical protein
MFFLKLSSRFTLILKEDEACEILTLRGKPELRNFVRGKLNLGAVILVL